MGDVVVARGPDRPQRAAVHRIDAARPAPSADRESRPVPTPHALPEDAPISRDRPVSRCTTCSGAAGADEHLLRVRRPAERQADRHRRRARVPPLPWSRRRSTAHATARVRVEVAALGAIGDVAAVGRPSRIEVRNGAPRRQRLGHRAPRRRRPWPGTPPQIPRTGCSAWRPPAVKPRRTHPARRHPSAVAPRRSGGPARPARTRATDCGCGRSGRPARGHPASRTGRHRHRETARAATARRYERRGCRGRARSTRALRRIVGDVAVVGRERHMGGPGAIQLADDAHRAVAGGDECGNGRLVGPLEHPEDHRAVARPLVAATRPRALRRAAAGGRRRCGPRTDCRRARCDSRWPPRCHPATALPSRRSLRPGCAPMPSGRNCRVDEIDDRRVARFVHHPHHEPPIVGWVAERPDLRRRIDAVRAENGWRGAASLPGGLLMGRSVARQQRDCGRRPPIAVAATIAAVIQRRRSSGSCARVEPGQSTASIADSSWPAVWIARSGRRAASVRRHGRTTPARRRADRGGVCDSPRAWALADLVHRTARHGIPAVTR